MVLWAFILAGFAGGQDAVRFDLSEPESQAPTPIQDPPVAAKPQSQKPAQPEGKVIGVLGIVTKDDAPIAVPDDRGIVSVVRCPEGTYVTATQKWGDWIGILMLNGRTGWIRKNQITLTEYQVIQPADSPNTTLGNQVLQIAASMQGVPYRYGGSGIGGIDCSRVVQLVFARVGASLPRTAAEQSNVGRLVQWRDLQPGDRLYFSMKGRKVDHCGVYAGGNMFIHASSNRGGVAFDRIDLPNYSSRLVVARR